MNGAVEVLAELCAKGIRVEPRPGNKLHLTPARAIDPALLEQVRQHKAELRALLSHPPDSGPADTSPSLPPDYPSYDLSDREEDETDRLAQADYWEPPKEIPPAVAREIARIETDALAYGWSRERLWSFRFWPHTHEHPRGLASLLDPSDRLIEVTADHIVIEKGGSRRTRQRYWRDHA